MGLIGPNGSGKTTTIKLILNMLKRTGGTVKVMGLDNIAEEQKVKSELGVVFDTNYFSDDWKVSQVEKSISVFYPNWDSQKFADMLRKFHIAPTKKVKELSKGMQMKLMLACAFSYNAKLLILDEPSMGLAPKMVENIFAVIAGLRARGVALLLIEQNARLALEVTDSAWVMDSGSIVHHGESTALLNDDQIAQIYLGEMPV